MRSKKEVDHRQTKPEAIYELKKVALKLRKTTKTVKEISEITGLSDQTVHNLFRKYDEGGLSAIKPKKRGRRKGEKRTLTPAQEKEILSLIVDKNPDQLKLKGWMWTRNSVKNLIKQKYGIDMPIRTVGEYLKRYPAIHAQAKAEKAEIYWGDETAVQNVANYVRGYAPKGHTPVVKLQTKKMHINMISAINNQGKLHFLLYSDAINSERLIAFMEAIVKTTKGKKVYLILDNLRVHHSKAVTEWVEDHKAQISLFHLPPYAPEYNPDEYLNNDLKHNIGTQAAVTTIQELENNANSFMKSLSENPKHVQSYFNHPKLKDYKLD